MSRLRLTHKDHVALGAAAVGAVIAVLVWVLWVIPIARSVDDAQTHALGTAVTVELDEGERVGIWASGIAPALGTLECTITDAGEERVPQDGPPSPAWDDALWWMTPKQGFEQTSAFTASAAGSYRIDCADSLDTYDGEFLVAGDSFGAGSIGVGRGDFRVGTVLVFSAVVPPLFALLLPIVVFTRAVVQARRPVSAG